MLTRSRLLLHVEGSVVLALALLLYWRLEASWLVFIVLVLAPDVGLLGYLRGSRLGAATYNLLHTYTVPLVVAALAWLDGSTLALSLAVTWIAHIAADRAMGFGMKYPTYFNDTHMQHV